MRTMLLTIGGLAALAACALASAAAAQSAPASDSWPDLKRTFFHDRPIVEDPAIVSLDAPARAEDAALAPMTLAAHTPPGDPRRIVKLASSSMRIRSRSPAPLRSAKNQTWSAFPHA